MPNQSLKHIRALVTRPEGQAQELAEGIRKQGGKALVMPMLKLSPLPETQPMRDLVLALDRYDKVIVISKQAACSGLDLIENYWPQLPQHIEWFAIGESTRRTLATYPIQAVCPEQVSNSENLLALDIFRNIAGQRILLLKGSGGRNHLEQTLTQRGAIVDRLSVYQRLRPEYSHDDMRQQLAEHDINVILAASGETVQHIHHYLPVQMIEQCRLVIPGQRITLQAQRLGFKHIVTAIAADCPAMLSALKTINGETSL